MSDECGSSNLLIVDSDLPNIKILDGFLDQSLYTVYPASDCQQAMQFLDRLPIDLILINISDYPPLSIDSFEPIINNSKHIPVILIVSDTSLDSLNRYFNAGIADIIQVPLHSKLIDQRLKNQLASVKQSNLADKLTDANKMAELGNMVAEIIHEVASPLGNLKLSLDYLIEHNEKISRQFEDQTLSKQALENHLKNTTKSLKISESSIDLTTNIILSFKQISVDQCSNKIMKINLLRYTKDILLMLRPKLKQHHHEIVLDIDERIELTNYPGALSQIMINLVNNSLLHAFQNDENGKIEILSAYNEKNVCIIYKDNGIGMDKNSLEKAFDKFYTTKAGSGGSGLGLHICKDLITDTLQGELLLESQLGLGTTFTITLPKTI